MKKLALTAAALGQQTDGLSVREAAMAAIKAVAQLIADVGLPTTWASFGKKEDIPKVVEMMTDCPWITAFYGWAKRKMTKEAATELVTRSYEGSIGKGIF
jgi:alcohol dehydrogenase